MGQDAVDGGGQQIVFHTHVEQTGNAAGRVIGMQGRQHQMAGQGRLDGDAAGFQVAHFADHDHVRILADDRAQGMGEVEPDLRFGLDLVDAFDLVFDRIFNRDDLDVRRVDFRQRGVQRGGLTRTGRAGDQQNTVRQLQHVDELGQKLVGETQCVEIEYHRFTIENTHHHRFTVRGRHGGNTQIQLLTLHPQHDATVLRQAAFGDVELGHDLDAGNHRGGRTGRWRLDFLQHTVDAVTHFQSILERLDVNIRGPRLDCALDDQIDQANDRRFGSQIAQMLDIVFGAAVTFAEVFDNRAHG